MNMAKETCEEVKILNLSLFGTPSQKKTIDTYFKKNKGKKKARTILDWALSAIASEESGQAQELRKEMERRA